MRPAEQCVRQRAHKVFYKNTVARIAKEAHERSIEARVHQKTKRRSVSRESFRREP
jgi:hypothetical protein